MCKSLMKIIS